MCVLHDKWELASLEPWIKQCNSSWAYTDIVTERWAGPPWGDLTLWQWEGGICRLVARMEGEDIMKTRTTWYLPSKFLTASTTGTSLGSHFSLPHRQGGGWPDWFLRVPDPTLGVVLAAPFVATPLALCNLSELGLPFSNLWGSISRTPSTWITH